MLILKKLMFYSLLESTNDFIWSFIFLPCVLSCGLLITLRCRALPLRRFSHVMKMTVGSLFGEKSENDGISPFQAAATALASTVGTGNIIGTAQAIALGGPGSLFWMCAAALLGMMLKYAEICLSLLYRQKDSVHGWLGGPMYYIEKGLGSRFRPMAKAYALFAALAAFGMGNLSQINSAADAVTEAAGSLSAVGEQQLRLILGLVLCFLCAAVVLGGGKRIGVVAEKLVPIMSALFILMSVAVIICHAHKLPRVLGLIISEAFRPRAAMGAVWGMGWKAALVWGLRRSAFSNEAGLGSAGIAHAGAETSSPVKQGFWGVFEVFVDTVVICSLTALCILCSGVDIPWGEAAGFSLLNAAFETVFGSRLSSQFLAIALLLFGVASVLGWALYGSRCILYLLGKKAVLPYQIIYLLAIVIGCVMSTEKVWALSDLFNALMSVPNFFALFSLTPKVSKLNADYFKNM